MFEVAFVLFAKAGMPAVDARAYWATTHADLVWRIPGVRRYLQGGDFLGEAPPSFLGIALLAFDDQAGFEAAAQSDAFAAAVADIANFADPAQLPTAQMRDIPARTAREGGQHVR